MGKHLAILALDIASSTGWALLDRHGNVTSGVQKFDLKRGESPGMRFLRFRRWLGEVLTLGACAGNKVQSAPTVDVIAYEQAHHRGGAATACLVGLATVMLEEAARLGIEVSPVKTGTLKKHATGSGAASKADMIEAATVHWALDSTSPCARVSGLPLSDDEADALCVLAWACDELGVRT